MREASIIDGKRVAERLRSAVAMHAEILARTKDIRPGLALVVVGDDPASRGYVAAKVKQAAAAGIRTRDHHVPRSATERDLLALVAELNADPAVHGILVQLPLPEPLRDDAVLRAIDPRKDVDGLHPFNAGLLAAGQLREAFIPPTPLGCLLLLDDTLGDLAGRHAVVVGRSNLVGGPLARLLLRRDCTVTLAHSKTRALAEHTRAADILVAAVGRPAFVTADMIREGAAVIDVGINRVPGNGGTGRVVGDVAFADALGVAGALTPVPGGVGPMTVACLLANTLRAACLALGVIPPDWSELLRNASPERHGPEASEPKSAFVNAGDARVREIGGTRA